MKSTIFKPDPRAGDEIFDGAGYEDLTRPGFICDAHTHLRCGARDVTINDFTLARM